MEAVLLVSVLIAIVIVGSLLIGANSPKPVTVVANPSDIVLGSLAISVPGLGVPLYRLTPEEQKHHATIWGKTGSGKSKLLHSIFVQHLSKGNAVALIDPHHDLAADILAYLVREGFFKDSDAYRKLIYLDWGSGYIVPFNILAFEDQRPALDTINDAPHSVALNVLDGAYRIWPELRSAPLFKELHLSGVLTLISNGLPISYLHRLLDDADFRRACLSKVDDPLVLEAWHNFDKLSAREQAEKAGSTMRRAFDLTFHPIARLSLGSPDNYVRHKQWAADGVSVIHDLGKIKDPLTKQILGALLMVDFEQAFMSRAGLPPSERKPCTLLVDEWASFAAQEETIGHVLSQTRKYGLRMYLAGQSMSQIGSERLSGALENCRLTVAFGLGRDSAVTQSRQIASIDPYLIKEAALTASQHAQYFPVLEQFESWTQELQNLETREAYVKVGTKPPVKIKTLSVSSEEADADEMAEVLATYRSLYHRTAHEAEQATATVLLPAGATTNGQARRGVPSYTRVYQRKQDDDAHN